MEQKRFVVDGKRWIWLIDGKMEIYVCVPLGKSYDFESAGERNKVKISIHGRVFSFMKIQNAIEIYAYE